MRSWISRMSCAISRTLWRVRRGLLPKRSSLYNDERMVHGGDALVQQLPFAFLERKLKIKPCGGPGQDKLLDTVGMDIDKAGGYISAMGVDDLIRSFGQRILNRMDAVAFQQQVSCRLPFGRAIPAAHF